MLPQFPASSVMFRSGMTARSGANFSGRVGVRSPGWRLDLLEMTAGANRITRVLDAPQEAVWKAWADPTHFWSESFDKLEGIL